MTDSNYHGSCLCGSVRVKLPRDGAMSAICHCTHCQKQTGSAYSTVLMAPAADVEVEGQLATFNDANDQGQPVQRIFCPRCGSPIETASAASAATGFRLIKSGLLDGGAPAPQIQIFCDSALDWPFSLQDVPRFARMPIG